MTDVSTTYDDVLIPTDGSPRAERAVEHGVELADQNDATVHGLHVVDERRYGETPALSTYELTFEQAEDAGEELTETVAERAQDDALETTTTVTRGTPHEEIVEYAEANDIDLIVMGRTGASGVEMPHMGSVTDRVLRTTDVPVFPV